MCVNVRIQVGILCTCTCAYDHIKCFQYSINRMCSMHACTHVCMYAYMHVCNQHIRSSMYVCAYAPVRMIILHVSIEYRMCSMYACMHACMHACTHVRMYACTHVCMYACMHVCNQRISFAKARQHMLSISYLRTNEMHTYIHTYIHRYIDAYIHTGVQAGDDSTSALTPRARAWVGAMSLPQDQSTHIALALADNLYTSVDIIVEEDPESMLARPGFGLLKAGAAIVLRKKLAELKVRNLV